MSACMADDWTTMLRDEMNKPYFLDLMNKLNQEYLSTTVYPDNLDLFQALFLTSYHSTKVVILGQDPYHGAHQAHGLSFSVRPGIALPPTLKNIFLELQADIGCSLPQQGCLKPWAEQGVLLLNSVLSVRKSEPHSHRAMGWEKFTDHIFSLLNQRNTPVIFILWGNDAKQKIKLIHSVHHRIICSAHPSPLSAYRGFFGSKPFSRANNYLRELGIAEIDWQLKT